MPTTPSQPALPLVTRSAERSGVSIVADLSTLAPQALLCELLNLSLILPEQWAGLTPAKRDQLQQSFESGGLLELLVDANLLTKYQAARIRAGKSFGLILGNYRILDRIGAGGMGVVYRAEHVRMRRQVAIKVLSVLGDQDMQLALRFFSEMRTVARLQHPNIVTAIDAGEARPLDPDAAVLYYFVMEFIEGTDLDELVSRAGPMAPVRACDLIYQVASALAEAHKHQLVHRDIKPSNILITTEEQAKLLDFGLARRFQQRLTEPGTVLGTIDYLAPEQARDSSGVDIRADIYALGGTLFWCLAGRTPFPAQPSLTQELALRMTQAPPSIRRLRPDLPGELDSVIARMMALNPDDRYATPEVVMRALLPFLRRDSREHAAAFVAGHEQKPVSRAPALPTSQRPGRVLVIDDECEVRNLCVAALQSDELHCESAAGGAEGLALLAARPFDVVLLDIDMPGMSGLEVVQRLREHPPCLNLKIIMFSGRATPDEMARLLLAGADDFVSKPFSLVQLMARVKAALCQKASQDRADQLNRQLLAANGELERNLSLRDRDLVHVRNALVLSLAKLVEHCDTETGAHLMRVQRYCRCLAEQAAQIPLYAGAIDEKFVHLLECCAPLHDIGKVALPDHILMKPGKLTPEERILMKEHTTIGANTLQEVARQHGTAVVFLQLAIDIARHHHERFDGTGYPDRLAGTAIPLAARLMTLADVYDALRSRRVYKPALSHGAAMQIMLAGSPGQFDPSLLPALEQCAGRMEAIYKELTE
jgi:response regulator RpfG family c-di-GMP phosphodiesterase